MNVLAVDVDNTLADYTDGLRRWMRRHYGQVAPMGEPDVYDFARASGWRFPMGFRHAHLSAVDDGLYRSLDPYPGAADVLRGLSRAGWRIVVVTSRAEPRAADDTRWWLERHRIPFDLLAFGDKTLTVADVAVDDDPEALEAWMRARPSTRILRMAHGYNHVAPGRAVADWPSLGRILSAG